MNKTGEPTAAEDRLAYPLPSEASVPPTAGGGRGADGNDGGRGGLTWKRWLLMSGRRNGVRAWSRYSAADSVSRQDRASYDLIAEKWSRERSASGFRERPYVDRFLEFIEPGAHVLDLGCGSGTPIARYLLDRGYRVTGVDASPEMLRLAWTNCPEAQFIAGDMTSIEFSDRYHGIIAWDSIFHIPKAQHGELFQTMHEWLRPGAPVFLSLGGSEDEFTARMFDVDFFYSGHSPDVSVALLRETGFAILLSEVDDPSSRGHVAILCRKAANLALNTGAR